MTEQTLADRRKQEGGDMTTTTPGGAILHHDDHGLLPAHLDLIDQVIARSRLQSGEGVHVEVVDLPEGVPDLLSALYGPTVGDAPISEDEVTYEVRGSRRGPSRLIDRPLRPCRRMVVIFLRKKAALALARWADPWFEVRVLTAYGTQAAAPTPREWWDHGNSPREAVEAGTFWGEHALATGVQS